MSLYRSPYRMVTLLEILEHKAEPFCRISSVLGQAIMIMRHSSPTEETISGLTGSLGELQREVQRLGLVSVDKHIERIKHDMFERGQVPTAHAIEELYNRLRDALEERFFLSVPPEMVELYQQTKPLFGDNVEAKFPNMSEDIAEAGKCLGLARPTAAVFHLMRVMELAVRKLGDHLGVTLVDEKNWQCILDEVNKAIKALDHKQARTKTLAGAAGHLYAVKVAWRNEVMHPKQTYTPDEASAIFDGVRVFMVDLAAL